MSGLEEVRVRMRALMDSTYPSVDWKGDDLAIGELPALPDWLLGVAIKREFGELGSFDPTTNKASIDGSIRNRVTQLFLDITALIMEGTVALQNGQRSIPVEQQEAHYALSFHQSNSTRPNFEDLSEEQMREMEFFQCIQMVTHWITMVLLQRARELRLEQRIGG